MRKNINNAKTKKHKKEEEKGMKNTFLNSVLDFNS